MKFNTHLSIALLTLVIVFLGTRPVHAQLTSFIFDPPSGVVDTTIPASGLVIFDIFQTNVSGNPLTLSYTKVSETLAPGWYYSLCDLGTCYPFLPAQGTMNQVDTMQNGFLGFNVDPSGYSGTTILSYYVYNAQNPSDGDTVTWIINANAVAATPTTVVEGFSIYPIPADVELHVTLPVSKAVHSSYAILDLSGRVLAKGKTNIGNFTVSTSGLPSGCYLFTVSDAQGVVHTKRFFVQHY